ncbi:MAG: nucleotidyltransferase domain-containing protein [Porphyromonadaceae bacterium]|nr:MAG: nucleotidyltransferase domain-containing protein [Porphyromonadaceae bacterium]
MTSTEKILVPIKKMVISLEPGSTVILFGSFARGDNRPDSDIDLLILLDREYLVRTECKGTCSSVFKAVGVALPPTIRLKPAE